MKSRYLILFSFLVLSWSVLILRAAYLQLYPQPQLDQLLQRQNNKMVSIPSRRGSIFDRNGQRLAISVNTKSLFVDPSLVSQPKTLAKKLSPLLKMDRKVLQKKLKRKTRFVWLKRHLSELDYNKIASLEERSLGFIDESKRVYPKKEVLSQVLGFVGSDGKGLEGIEREFNTQLSGRIKKVKMLKDAKGRTLLIESKQVLKKAEGEDLTLTIDSELQYYLEKELQKTVTQFQAKSAVGLVLEAETSEVLAMANVPTLDLNTSVSAYGLRRNRVVTDAIEPGSTMKPFVVAMALEKKLIKPNTLIDCEGKPFQVGRRWIREAESHHYFDKLTPAGILVHSSNIGTAKIAFMLGEKSVYQGIEKLGFTQPTQIQLGGESKGILNSRPWSQHLLSNVAFGQGIAVTPLQMSTAYAALANGGFYHPPTIIKGSVRERQRVFSAETAHILRLMLTQVTASDGTGASARVVGYPVAGKTGTAQKADLVKGGYKEGAYVASFAGFIPAHNPKFVIYIAVDEPQKYYYGSQVAAPVFAKVASYAVRRSGVVPVLLSKNSILKKLDPFKKESKTLDVLQEQALNKVIKKSHKLMIQNTEMPNLIGYSLRDVLSLMQSSPVKYQVKGSGYVYKTRPQEGDFISKNKAITIYLKEEL